MEGRKLPYQYLPVSHIGVQEMDRNNERNAKNLYSCRSCLTRLRSGKCNAVLLLVSALIVWFIIHMINVRESAELSNTPYSREQDSDANWENSQSDVIYKNVKGLEDAEHFSVESTTHSERPEDTTRGMDDQYDKTREELAESGSGNYGSTESPSNSEQEEGFGAYDMEEDTGSNSGDSTVNPINNFDNSGRKENVETVENLNDSNQIENLASTDDDVHDKTQPAVPGGEGKDPPANDSSLTESLKNVLYTVNDLSKNAEGTDSQSDNIVIDKVLTDNRVSDDKPLENRIMRQYDYTNSVEKNSFLDIDNNKAKFTDTVQPVADSDVKLTEEKFNAIATKDMYTGADMNQGSNKTINDAGSNAEVFQEGNLEGSVHFKSRDVMSAKLGEETKHKVQNTAKDKNVIRKKRSLVHIIKVPLEDKSE